MAAAAFRCGEAAQVRHRDVPAAALPRRRVPPRAPAAVRELEGPRGAAPGRAPRRRAHQR
eukprot:10823286-Alexandrium_andersonii.AAC.1